jgi:alkaline phosphatase D
MGRRTLLDRLVPPKPGLDRRSFLTLSTGAAAAALAGCKPSSKADSGDTAPLDPDPDGTCGPGEPTAAGDTAGAGASPFTASPFGLGVASGDPLHDRVILWTRLVVEPTDVTATPTDDVDVIWELAADEGFGELLQTGLATATGEHGHSVHVDVDGLDPATTYWYRFRVGDFTSEVGRTRTLPCDDAQVDAVRIGFTTCQRYPSGWYVVQRDMAAQQLDLVISLGDYIYEGGGRNGRARTHELNEPWDLTGYRDRYGLYKSDPDLRALHASAPFMAIWDDHEVDNNYAGEHSQDGGVDPGDWAARRAAAYKVWWEHMPIRADPPTADALRIHRHATFGDLAQVVLLDGRQYRDDQPCDDRIGSRCEETDDERAFLGSEQEAWFEERLQAASTRWVLLANPVVMLPMDFNGVFLNPDQWDGYPRARQRLVDAVRAHASGTTVAFTGDIHASGVGFVPQDPLDPTSEPAIAEFVVPAATSYAGDTELASVAGILAAQPHISWWDFIEQGWVLAEVDAARVVARYRHADDVTDPASAVRDARAWVVEAGAPAPFERP